MDKFKDAAARFWPLGTAREKHVLAAFGRECAADAEDRVRKEVIDKVWLCLALAGRSLKTFKILFTTPAAALRSAGRGGGGQVNDKCEHSAYWQGNYGTCMACRAEIAEIQLKASQEEIAALAAKFAELEIAEVRYLDVTRRLEEENAAMKAELCRIGKVLVGCAVTGCAICEIAAPSGQGEKQECDCTLLKGCNPNCSRCDGTRACPCIPARPSEEKI